MRWTTKEDVRTVVTVLVVGESVEDDEQDNRIPEYTMKELISATAQSHERKICRQQRNQSGRSQRSCLVTVIFKEGDTPT